MHSWGMDIWTHSIITGGGLVGIPVDDSMACHVSEMYSGVIPFNPLFWNRVIHTTQQQFLSPREGRVSESIFINSWSQLSLEEKKTQISINLHPFHLQSGPKWWCLHTFHGFIDDDTVGVGPFFFWILCLERRIKESRFCFLNSRPATL